MAIQLPNNKISRTLPEQVGFNSAKIEEIIKWINDSDFIDKVLNLSDPSGTLTEAQYAIADLSPSYIVYGGKVFIKSLEDSDNIDFFKAGTDMSGSDSMIASVERVRVVKATKGYQYAVVQLFESYNKTQLNSLLASKANLSGAAFTGAITAPSIVEDMIGYAYDGTSNITNCVIDTKYAGIVKNGNKLTLCIYFDITRTDASTGNLLGAFTIPLSVAQKIIPNEYNQVELKQLYCAASYNSGKNIFGTVNKLTNNVLSFYLYGLTGQLEANTKYTCRFETTFLLSDNLAQ